MNFGGQRACKMSLVGEPPNLVELFRIPSTCRTFANNLKQILGATAATAEEKWTVQSLISRAAPGPQAPRDPTNPWPRRLQSGQRSWRRGPARLTCRLQPSHDENEAADLMSKPEQTIGVYKSNIILKYFKTNRWVHSNVKIVPYFNFSIFPL